MSWRSSTDDGLRCIGGVRGVGTSAAGAVLRVVAFGGAEVEAGGVTGSTLRLVEARVRSSGPV